MFTCSVLDVVCMFSLRVYWRFVCYDFVDYLLWVYCLMFGGLDCVDLVFDLCLLGWVWFVGLVCGCLFDFGLDVVLLASIVLCCLLVCYVLLLLCWLTGCLFVCVACLIVDWGCGFWFMVCFICGLLGCCLHFGIEVTGCCLFCCLFAVIVLLSFVRSMCVLFWHYLVKVCLCGFWFLFADLSIEVLVWCYVYLAGHCLTVVLGLLVCCVCLFVR